MLWKGINSEIVFNLPLRALTVFLASEALAADIACGTDQNRYNLKNWLSASKRCKLKIYLRLASKGHEQSLASRGSSSFFSQQIDLSRHRKGSMKMRSIKFLRGIKMKMIRLLWQEDPKGLTRTAIVRFLRHGPRIFYWNMPGRQKYWNMPGRQNRLRRRK